MLRLWCRFIFVLFGLLSTGCVFEQTTSGAQTLTEPAIAGSRASKLSACVSFQGNGVYFSSHLGALIALLESNVEPVFASGGSSGAIIAGIARALVDNPSLSDRHGFSPKEAAQVLAASAPIIESTIFLPRLTTPFQLLDALDVFLTGSSQGVLRADPSNGMVNSESIVGQSALTIAFFASSNFSKVLGHNSLAEREFEVGTLWSKFVNAVHVTPEQVADAMLTSREVLMAQKQNDLVVIQDRIFKLFRSRSDTFVNDYREQQKLWNEILTSKGILFGFDSKERRQAAFKMLLEKVKTFESFDALAATLSGHFMLPDPDRVYGASGGLGSNANAAMQIPSNTIIHATARRAALVGGEWKEDAGLSSLHQVYFADPRQVGSVAARLLQPEHNPLKPEAKDLVPVIPSDRLVVTTQRLGPALAASIGEPTAFMRHAITLDAQARSRLGWIQAGHALIGNGGWLETVSLGTSRKFDQCAADNVDLYFYTMDGGGLSSFAKMAFFGLLVDAPVRGLLGGSHGTGKDIRALLSGKQGEMGISGLPGESGVKRAIASMENLLVQSESAMGRLGQVAVNFNNVHPLGVGEGGRLDAGNMFIRSNRRAMLLASYEFTRKILAGKGLGGPTLNLWNVPGDRVDILSRSSPHEILAEVNRVFPR